MAWTYHDYPTQATLALRLERARLFQSEIMLATTANIAAGGGKSRESDSLVQLLDRILADIAKYEAALGVDGKGLGVTLADLRR